MNLIDGYRDFMMRSGRIRERMTRAEFWPYFAFNVALLVLVSEMLPRAGASSGTSFDLGELIFLILMLFFIGPVIQRVNDANLRKRWLFIIVVPYIGIGIVLLMLIQKSFPATTECGPCRA